VDRGRASGHRHIMPHPPGLVGSPRRGPRVPREPTFGPPPAGRGARE
jgi:hypothetical protein